MIEVTFGTNAHLVLGVILEETLDTTTGELEHTTVCQQHSMSIDSSFKCNEVIFSCRFERANHSELGTRHE